MIKTIVIGNGSIGKELQKQIKRIGWSVDFVLTSKDILDREGKRVNSISEWKKYIAADIVFIAVPTSLADISFEYIRYCVEKNIPVVTCEKGALSEYFEKLQSNLKSIGYNATVGGGTRMLKYLNSRNKENISSVTGVVNGTLNYIFSRLSEGATKELVIKDILENKYSEPDAKTFTEIINTELSDLYRKAIIIANTANLWIKFENPKEISHQIIEKAISNPKEYRFLFLMAKVENGDFIDGLKYQIKDWFIYAGIFNIKNFVLDFPEGVNNVLYIKEGESLYSVSGPGAGPEPTALSMIADAKEILKMLK